MTTVYDISLRMMPYVTDLMHGTVTDGSKNTLKDSVNLTQDNEFYNKGTLWIKSGTHARKVLPISTFAAQIATFDALGTAICTQQVETATVVGTITLTGNATVVVTAASMPNSPKTISVAVTNTDSAATVAGKIRTALTADTDVNAFFSIGGTNADIILTTKVARADDSTMNMSIANGTCTGLTAAPTSANTTAGVAGPRYAVARGAFPWEQIMGAIQQALDMTYVIAIDSSLSGDGTTLSFPLPATVREVKDVYLGDRKTISNHWDVEDGYLVFDEGFPPYAGDTIHLHHKTPHAEINAYDVEIHRDINETWLVLQAAFYLLFWAAEQYGKKPGFMITERINSLLAMPGLKNARARKGGPGVSVKSVGGGREYTSLA